MLIPFLRRCGRFLACKRAVSALEYAVLAGVVLAGVGAAIVTFADDIANSIEDLGDEVVTATESVDVENQDLSTP